MPLKPVALDLPRPKLLALGLPTQANRKRPGRLTERLLLAGSGSSGVTRLGVLSGRYQIHC